MDFTTLFYLTTLQAAAGAAAPKSGGKGKASKASASKQPKPAAPALPAAPLVKSDPGGKVIWAKVANYPWWPAKTLDPSRDRSFPPDADPPRPNAIPVRFFGTHEFAWMGSKRALTEWEQGLSQFSKECDQESFQAAIQEAEEYRKGGTLPDAFYVPPAPESGRKGKAKRRGSGGAVARKPGEARSRTGRGAGGADNRGALVQERKRQRVLYLGLAPCEDSPYGAGRVAPNTALQQAGAVWATQFPQVLSAAKEAVAAATVAPARALVPTSPPAATAVAAPVLPAVSPPVLPVGDGGS